MMNKKKAKPRYSTLKRQNIEQKRKRFKLPQQGEKKGKFPSKGTCQPTLAEGNSTEGISSEEKRSGREGQGHRTNTEETKLCGNVHVNMISTM